MSDKEYDNTNRGALFKNSKRTSDKSPEYNGSLNVGGVEYWINGWVKEGKSGKFFSLSVKSKDAKPEAVFPDAPTSNDELPF